MPARRWLKSPRRLLTAPKISIRAQKFGRLRRIDFLAPVEPVTDESTPLNQPESRIYYALRRLGIHFKTQVNILGGSILGGGRLDFYLEDYQLDIEYQGPFHQTTGGTARDALRNAGVQSLGIRVEFIYERDLPNLERRILEIIGYPIRGLAGL